MKMFPSSTTFFPLITTCFENVGRNIDKFCNAHSQQDCIRHITSQVSINENVLKGTLWAELVSGNFEVESLLLGSNIQHAADDAVKRDDLI